MNTAFSSFFLVLLAALCVQCQEGEECGFLKIKCRDNQFCFRPRVKLDFDVGVCLPYLRKGALCNEELKCSPELECKERSSLIKFKTCQEPSAKPTDDGLVTVPDTPEPEITEAPEEEITEAPEEEITEVPEEEEITEEPVEE